MRAVAPRKKDYTDPLASNNPVNVSATYVLALVPTFTEANVLLYLLMISVKVNLKLIQCAPLLPLLIVGHLNRHVWKISNQIGFFSLSLRRTTKEKVRRIEFTTEQTHDVD